MSGPPNTGSAPQRPAHIEPAGDRAVRVSGDLTFATVPAVVNALRPGMRQGPGVMQVDLAGVGHSDSAGLALLVEWVRQARRHETRLSFRNVPAQMLAIARVTSLQDILHLEPDS